ncbi:MAG: phosphate ABC transporter permease PstA [Lachnospiraceae bacterium]|nr:phosphate ABC transporter permease PstA [Lachnospiraceae bacterium]
MNQKQKDAVTGFFVYGSSFLTVAILVVILGFIFIKGIPHINLHFLTANYENETTYVNIDANQASKFSDIGLAGEFNEDGQWEITSISSDSAVKGAVDMQGAAWKIKTGDVITKVGSQDLEALKDGTEEEKNAAVTAGFSEAENGQIRLKMTRLGGGIRPMVITTLYMILLSLLVAAPIGILAAIYLNEYAKQGKVVTLIRFAVQNLAGIPSILYGLFGSLFFVQVCHMGYSILAGALTLSILLLPVIISTTEEALKAIPMTYRESSLGLGATKLQTISKVVVPNALPGILVAVILSIGRIVGESAALLLTAGTVASIPGALTGDSAAGATLTIKAYTALKEEGNIGEACAIGVVLMVLVILLNFASKMITRKYLSKQGN